MRWCCLRLARTHTSHEWLIIRIILSVQLRKKLNDLQAVMRVRLSSAWVAAPWGGDTDSSLICRWRMSWAIGKFAFLHLCDFYEYIRSSAGLVDQHGRRNKRRAVAKILAVSDDLAILIVFILDSFSLTSVPGQPDDCRQRDCPNFVRSSASLMISIEHIREYYFLGKWAQDSPLLDSGD